MATITAASTPQHNRDEAPARMSSRLDYIDGLRGLAILVVVIFHAGIWGGIRKSGEVMHWLLLGRIGVDLFLVLSGFCLFYPLVKSGTGAVKALDLREYARRRARRILPPYYAAVALSLAVSFIMFRFGGRSWWDEPLQDSFPWQGVQSAESIITHLLLVHGFFNAYAHSIDGAFWSLSLEWQFYWLLPILVLIARKRSLAWAIAVPIIVTLAFRVALHTIRPSLLNTYVGSELCFSRWVEFAAGMLAAYMTANAASIRGLANLKPAFMSAALLISAIGAVCVQQIRGSFMLLPFLWAIALGLLVLHAGTKGARLRAFCEFKPLVKLGEMSYSLYLIHGAVFLLIATPISRMNVSLAGRETLYFTAATLAAVVIAYGFHCVVERPFMTAVRKPRPNIVFARPGPGSDGA